MKHLLTFYLVFWLLTLCFRTEAIIIVDIDQSKEIFNLPGEGGEKITANRSIRMVTFDTDLQKILEVNYLLALNPRLAYTYEFAYCTVAYGPLVKDNLNPTITPKTNSNVWLHSSGSFQTDLPIVDLAGSDETRPHGKIVKLCQPNFPTFQEVEKILNNAELAKKNKQYKVKHSIPLQFTWHADKLKGSLNVINLAEKDGIGELICDLTMMSFGYTKLDAKHGANKGFDGLYEKEDRIIAAEVKFHKNPPTLDQIARDHLISKFDIQNKGALSLMKDIHKNKIIAASKSNSLYLLPYSLMNDGVVNARIQFYTIPTLEEGTPSTPPKLSLDSLTFASPITPQSPKQDKLAAIKDLSRTFAESPEEFLALVMEALNLSEDPKSPSLARNRAGEKSDKIISKVLFPRAGKDTDEEGGLAD